jgi:hypothetical protein
MFTNIRELYSDELFYGFFGRNLSIESDYIVNNILNELKLKNREPFIQFSSKLNIILKYMPDRIKYDNDYIIQNHTIFPVFAPFLTKTRSQSTICKIIGENPSGINELLGVPGGHLFNIKKSLRYCPLCARQDMEKFGEAYFHRIHHVDGVLVCPEHACLIKEYANIDKLPLNNRFYVIDANKLDYSIQQIEDAGLENMLYHIAKEAVALLNLNFRRYDIESIRKLYLNLVKQKSFLTYSGNVRIKELCKQFKQHYNEELLSTIMCNFDLNSSQNWIRQFFGYKNVLLHPIKHILLINLLCDGVSEFLNNDSTYNYFGKGPWPCLNPTSDHYKQLVVNGLKVTEEYKTKRPVGAFTCTCGFVYSRRGPDIKPEDKYKIGTIKQYGHEWESRLSELLLCKKLSLRAISSVLKCDSKTVVKYGRQLGLDNCIASSIPLPESAGVKRARHDSKAEYEAKVSDLINRNPSCDKRTLRTLLPKEFLWLQKYDLEWLNKNVPVQRNYRKEVGKPKVVWNDMDAEISKCVSHAYQEILAYESPQRVTKALLGRISGRNYYLKNKIDKLPQTAAMVNIIIESIEEYKLRISSKSNVKIPI